MSKDVLRCYGDGVPPWCHVTPVGDGGSASIWRSG